MSAFVTAVLDGFYHIRSAAVRLVMGLLVALCALTLAAVPAMAQTITGATISPSTYSGTGQTITLTVSVNSGNRVASSATVTSQIGAVYSCPIADTANTGVNFTCTATYSTTATDVANLQIQEQPVVRMLSFATPTIMTYGGILQSTYVAPPPPAVTSLSPTTGPAAGGTSVVLTGTNFAGVTGVNFGTLPATGFTVNSATQITATSPAGTGTVNVRVTTGAGTSASGASNQFTYATANVAPVITLNPVSQTINAPGNVTFTASASGTPTPTVQWEASINGGASYGPWSGGTSTTLVLNNPGVGANGWLFRAVFTNTAGSATTTAATLTVNQASQTITVTSAAPGAAQVGGATYSPTATASSGLSVVTTIDPSASGVCSIAAGVVSFQNVGSCTINFNQAGNASFSAAPQVQQSFAVGQGANVITFPALSDTPFASAPPALGATASSGLAVSYASNSTGVCTVAGGTISFVSAGTCSITASQAGNANYVAATSVTQTFAVTQSPNTITFPPLADTAFTSAPPVLSATASSGLAVSYVSNSTGICTVTGGTISFAGTGTCSITASQAGNVTYQAATPVTQTFAVTPGVNTITFAPMPDTPFTSAPPIPSATASSGLAISFASNSTGVCTVTGGTISFVSAGTCSITASQAGGGNYAAATPVTRTFAVLPGANTITFPPLTDTPFTSAPPVLSASASSGLAISYGSNSTGVCTATGSTISFVAAGTCSITASQAGGGNYAAATPVTRTFAVTQGVNTITFAPLPNRALGSGSFALTGTASSGLTVVFTTTTSGVCSVSGTTVSLLAVGTCTINASQAGNANFLPATQVSQSFQVTRAVTSVGLTSSAPSVFFGMPVTLTATVSGNSPTGTVTFSDGATVLGTAALSGNVATLTTSALPTGARQLTATYSGDASNLPATSSAVSVAVNARPNPALDPEVGGTVSTQFNTVERFGRTQLDNIGGRLDRLHSDGEDQDSMTITLSQPRARLASNLPWEQGGQYGQSGYGYNAGQPGSVSGAMAGTHDPLGLASVPVQSAAGAAAAPGLREPRVVHIWASGDVSFGKQQPNGLVETRFTSSGLTVGMDGKVNDSLKLGVALGFAWDHSRFGTMGSESDATNASLAFYGSLKAAPKTFIDLIVGTGFGTIDSTRFSTTGGILLDGKRRQRQTFAALIVTVEAKAGQLQIAPYLRADGIWVNLSPYSETGSPFWALTYQSASQNSYSGSAGVRLRYPIDKDGRWLLTGKAEYRQRFSGDYAQLLDYADIQGAQGSPDIVTGQGVSDSTFTGGIGLEARLRTVSLRLGYDLTTMAGGNVANSISGGIVVKF